jgi:hypothetical protein
VTMLLEVRAGRPTRRQLGAGCDDERSGGGRVWAERGRGDGALRGGEKRRRLPWWGCYRDKVGAAMHMGARGSDEVEHGEKGSAVGLSVWRGWRSVGFMQAE